MKNKKNDQRGQLGNQRESLRELTSEEIALLACRPGVRRIAVENFLMSMGKDERTARTNLILDAGIYHWNIETYEAIADGIKLARLAKI